MATPGEMVGAMAAQSIGEPATQVLLNSIHLRKITHQPFFSLYTYFTRFFVFSELSALVYIKH